MKIKRSDCVSLWDALQDSDCLSNRHLYGAGTSIALNDLVAGSVLYGRGQELSGRSVLVATAGQFTTAAVLIELDGVARRIVICPPDLPVEYVPYVIEAADVDAIVSDRNTVRIGGRRPLLFCPCTQQITVGNSRRTVWDECRTEWVLLTSGTTGAPKLVAHTLASLAGAIEPVGNSAESVTWSTFYDIRRYGGLQIFLRAMLTGKSLVLMGENESTPEFLARAGALGVTHISGTPTQWRRALMSTAAHLIHPRYVRLSGEIVDQAILNRLSVLYPEARIVHAFASTEAGVAFEVNDCAAGFPVGAINLTPDVDMKIEEGTLRIRSARNASGYLGESAPRLKNDDGFIDTKDTVELRDNRYYFTGRSDGVINVGGLKVYPEEIEAVINHHPDVQMSLVRAKKNSITSAVIAADIVLRVGAGDENRDVAEFRNSIVQFCRESLASYKVPAIINIVPTLTISGSGKMMRQNA